jgi:hypothetical protein
MLHILTELLAEILGVVSTHVDLVGGSVKGERNCLGALGFTVMGKVTHNRHHCLLSHGQPFCWSGEIGCESIYQRDCV